MSGILYVTGTPIGNLGDFSPRAAETLESVDFIAAEDTRVTLKLLNHFGIKKPMVSYFEHNKRERGEIICNRIEQGENCAIVTDAGMPCISDPGEDLIKLCEERGIKTVVIPGPSAVISALAVSGLETGRFTFEGFLSVNKKSRNEHLDSLKNEHRTMIFYEAPHRLAKTLQNLVKAFGPDRQVVLARELTKRYEEFLRGSAQELVDWASENEVRGEFVMMVAGNDNPTTDGDDDPLAEMTAVEAVQALVASGLKATAAVKQVAKARDLDRQALYLEYQGEN